ncbi:MAG: hypothetical protein AAGF01_27860 [Cyanobacteria bacterium P01_G01_bin.38]
MIPFPKNPQRVQQPFPNTEASTPDTTSAEENLSENKPSLPEVTTAQVQDSPVIVIRLFFITLCGIFFKIIWDSQTLESVFRWRTFKPVFIAPIVFYAVYLISKDITDPIVDILLAFENGFFWQALLEAREAKYQMPSEEKTELN